MQKRKFFKTLVTVLLVLTLIFLTSTVPAVANVTTNEISVTENTNSNDSSAESKEKNPEKNVFASQIDPDTDYSFDKLTLSAIPQYLISSLGIDMTAENAPVSLSSCDAEQLNSFTTVNTDGSNTLYLFANPIKYADNQTGEIKFIDNTIVSENKTVQLDALESAEKIASDTIEATSKITEFKNASNLFDVVMPKSISDGITLACDDINIKITPRFTVNAQANLTQASLGSITEQVVEYANALGDGVHLQYVPINNGVKENIILDKYTGQNTFEFIVETGIYLPLYNEGEAIPFIDPKTEEIIFAIGQVDARDSYVGDETDGHFSIYNSLSLSPLKDGLFLLTVTVDKEFLENENTVFPVIIDPSITISSGNMLDTTVYSGHPDKQAYYSSAYNVAGYHGSTAGTGTAFIQISDLSSAIGINPGDITSATYKVYEGSGKTNTVQVQVGALLKGWYQTDLTYNGMLPSDKKNGTSYVSEISRLPRFTHISYLTINRSGWKNFDITPLVKNWISKEQGYDGWDKMRGFFLRTVDPNASSLHFCSANHGTYNPSIIINYNTSGTTFDVDAVYNPINDTKFRSFGYLIHGTSPEFKIKISTAGQYELETFNCDNYFGPSFPKQDTQIELLDSQKKLIKSDDNISSTNPYSSILIDLEPGTYYVNVYNSSGTRTNIKCYFVMAIQNSQKLLHSYTYYADNARDFYQTSTCTEPEQRNCLSYALRAKTLIYVATGNVYSTVYKILKNTDDTIMSDSDISSTDYVREALSGYTDSCVILYGNSETMPKHAVIIEAGSVKSKMDRHEVMRHSTIYSFNNKHDPGEDVSCYGAPMLYFTDTEQD